MILRVNVIVSLFGTFLLVKGAPYGKQDDDEFRDKKYDEHLKQVTKVGNTYVSGRMFLKSSKTCSATNVFY